MTAAWRSRSATSPGVDAAAGMGRLRSAVRAAAFADPDPAAVLTVGSAVHLHRNRRLAHHAGLQG
jgi:hypothetical protein